MPPLDAWQVASTVLFACVPNTLLGSEQLGTCSSTQCHTDQECADLPGQDVGLSCVYVKFPRDKCLSTDAIATSANLLNSPWIQTGGWIVSSPMTVQTAAGVTTLNPTATTGGEAVIATALVKQQLADAVPGPTQIASSTSADLLGEFNQSVHLQSPLLTAATTTTTTTTASQVIVSASSLPSSSGAGVDTREAGIWVIVVVLAIALIVGMWVKMRGCDDKVVADSREFSKGGGTSGKTPEMESRRGTVHSALHIIHGTVPVPPLPKALNTWFRPGSRVAAPPEFYYSDDFFDDDQSVVMSPTSGSRLSTNLSVDVRDVFVVQKGEVPIPVPAVPVNEARELKRLQALVELQRARVEFERACLDSSGDSVIAEKKE
ncbi:hypothetical protein HDU98_006909 [Podochytrium sp. JEL0797]|nr:hypothetical protein HDU98_006909 [Podochytrium sp. JEL0797]